MTENVVIRAGPFDTFLRIFAALCERWGLTVNARKTKVIHVRPKGRRASNFAFTCGGSNIQVVNKYKYLGLWFTDNIDLKYMAEQVAASAQRALGMLIAKSKAVGGFPHACFEKLYNSLVQSIIDYGASVWGHRDFSCIQAVQHRAVRSFLGVNKTTANAAVMGEVGWIPQRVSQKVCMVRQWFRYNKMDESRLNHHIIEWARDSNCCSMISKCKELFNELNLNHMFNLDLQYGKYDVFNIRENLMEMYAEAWSEEVNKVGSKNGTGLNKLRSYKMFKQTYKCEEYVNNKDIRYGDRRALAQMRCGSAPINIELGRYRNGVYLPAEMRLCPICNEGVEDEKHVILECSFYDDLREELLDVACAMDPFFENLDDNVKFVQLMSDEYIVKYTAKTCRLMLQRRKLFLMS